MSLDVRAAALLFDMDGTLVDSTAVVEQVWTEFADRHGLDPARVLAHAHGRLTEDTVARFVDDPQRARAESRAIDEDELRRLSGIVEVPGAAHLLRRLPASRWAVVTSASRPLAVRRMRAAGVPVPDVMVTADDVARGKPSPEGYRRAAALLGVEPGSCLVLEDAEAGVQAGLAAGARVLVVGGHTSPATRSLAGIRDFAGVRVTLEPEGVRLRAG